MQHKAPHHHFVPQALAEDLVLAKAEDRHCRHLAPKQTVGILGNIYIYRLYIYCFDMFGYFCFDMFGYYWYFFMIFFNVFIIILNDVICIYWIYLDIVCYCWNLRDLNGI